MIDELVNFKTAKLAKEKGFDITSWFGNDASLYDKEGTHVYYSNYGFMGSGLSENYIKAPTQSLLQRWLREEHRLNVVPLPNRYDSDVWYYFIGSKKITEEDTNWTYEQALEEGLQQALTLIN